MDLGRAPRKSYNLYRKARTRWGRAGCPTNTPSEESAVPTTTFELNLKPSFMADLLALPNKKTARLVQQKVEELQHDPTPDGHHKKKLKGHDSPVYRLRCGDYRLFYTFGKGWIRLLGIRLRRDAYEDESI